MKKKTKKLLIALLSATCLTGAAFGLAACGDDTADNNDNISTSTTITKGDKGDKGDTGAQGEKGEKGDTGDTGAQGPQGVQGATGAAGKDGTNGTDGDDGKGITSIEKATTTDAEDYDGTLTTGQTLYVINYTDNTKSYFVVTDGADAVAPEANNGKSAYEIWKDAYQAENPDVTDEDVLKATYEASIKGETGDSVTKIEASTDKWGIVVTLDIYVGGKKLDESVTYKVVDPSRTYYASSDAEYQQLKEYEVDETKIAIDSSNYVVQASTLLDTDGKVDTSKLQAKIDKVKEDVAKQGGTEVNVVVEVDDDTALDFLKEFATFGSTTTGTTSLQEAEAAITTTKLTIKLTTNTTIATLGAATDTAVTFYGSTAYAKAIDLNGNKLTIENNLTISGGTVEFTSTKKDKGTLEVKVTDTDDSIAATTSLINVSGSSTLNVSNVNVTSNKSGVKLASDAALSYKNGTITAAGSYAVYTDETATNATITLDGATVNAAAAETISLIAGTANVTNSTISGITSTTGKSAIYARASGSVSPTINLGANTVVNGWISGIAYIHSTATDAAKQVTFNVYTQSQFTNATLVTNSKIVLQANINATSDYGIINKVLTIDLNGYTITRTVTGDAINDGTFFQVQDNSVVTIQDSSAAKTGTITSNRNVVAGVTLTETTGTAGILYFKSGTIVNTVGNGLNVLAGGTVKVSGGTINAKDSAINGNNTKGTINIEVSGGTLTSTDYPAIYMPAQGSLKITGGTINGGVLIRMGTIEITGGTIVAPTTNVDFIAADGTLDNALHENNFRNGAIAVLGGLYGYEGVDAGNALNLTIKNVSADVNVIYADKIAQTLNIKYDSTYTGAISINSVDQLITAYNKTATDANKVTDTVKASYTVTGVANYVTKEQVKVSATDTNTYVPERVVATVAALNNALNETGDAAGQKYKVVLNEDLAITSITLGAADYTIDLNGHTLTLSGTISLADASKLTITGTGAVVALNEAALKLAVTYTANATIKLDVVTTEEEDDAEDEGTPKVLTLQSALPEFKNDGVTLDLNGVKLVVADTTAVAANVRIKDSSATAGIITTKTGYTTTNAIFTVTGAKTLTLDNVTVDVSVQKAVVVGGATTGNLVVESTATIKNAGGVGVEVLGTGEVAPTQGSSEGSAAATPATVQKYSTVTVNGKVEANGMAITSDYNATNGYVKIEVDGGTVTSTNNVAIYATAIGGKVDIKNGAKVTGASGVQINVGTLTVDGSEITANAKTAGTISTYSSILTGIAVASTQSAANNLSVTVTKSTLTGIYAVYDMGNTETNSAKVSVTLDSDSNYNGAIYSYYKRVNVNDGVGSDGQSLASAYTSAKYSTSTLKYAKDTNNEINVTSTALGHTTYYTIKNLTTLAYESISNGPVENLVFNLSVAVPTGEGYYDESKATFTDGTTDEDGNIITKSFKDSFGSGIIKLTESEILEYLQKGQKTIYYSYNFDWNGDGQYTQAIAVEIDLATLTISKSGTTVLEKGKRIEDIKSLTDLNTLVAYDGVYTVKADITLTSDVTVTKDVTLELGTYTGKNSDKEDVTKSYTISGGTVQVGNTYYVSTATGLENALKAEVETGKTKKVILVNDINLVTAQKSLSVAKNVELDVNGFEITTSSDYKLTYTVLNLADLKQGLTIGYTEVHVAADITLDEDITVNTTKAPGVTIVLDEKTAATQSSSAVYYKITGGVITVGKTYYVSSSAALVNKATLTDVDTKVYLTSDVDLENDLTVAANVDLVTNGYALKNTNKKAIVYNVSSKDAFTKALAVGATTINVVATTDLGEETITIPTTTTVNIVKTDTISGSLAGQHITYKVSSPTAFKTAAGIANTTIVVSDDIDLGSDAVTIKDTVTVTYGTHKVENVDTAYTLTGTAITYEVKDAQALAAVAAKDNIIIKLTDNISVTSNIDLTKVAELDLNGKTLTINGTIIVGAAASGSGDTAVAAKTGTLTITDSTVTGNVTTGGSIVQNGGAVTTLKIVESSVTIGAGIIITSNATATGTDTSVINAVNSTLTIDGATITGSWSSSDTFLAASTAISASNSTVNIEDGTKITFNGYISINATNNAKIIVDSTTTGTDTVTYKTQITNTLGKGIVLSRGADLEFKNGSISSKYGTIITQDSAGEGQRIDITITAGSLTSTNESVIMIGSNVATVVNVDGGTFSGTWGVREKLDGDTEHTASDDGASNITITIGSGVASTFKYYSQHNKVTDNRPTTAPAEGGQS